MRSNWIFGLFDLSRRPMQLARHVDGNPGAYFVCMRRHLCVRMRRPTKNILFRVEYMHERDAWLWKAGALKQTRCYEKWFAVKNG